MSSKRRTVLVVDDSALIRTVLRDVIGGMRGFGVIGTASNGREALDAIRAFAPDIVTLDVEMPGMDGLEALAGIMRESPRPVVMLSAAETSGSVDLTLRALDLGAVDFVRKGTATAARALDAIRPRLEAALQAAASANLGAVVRPAAAPERRGGEVRVTGDRTARTAIAVAASTGGPRALAEFVASLPADLDAAVLIAQHMPQGFTAGLARRLTQASPLRATEAIDGEPVLAGRVYLAPGGRHMAVTGSAAAGATIALDDGPTVWSVRPAADKLFVTVARAFGDAAVGVVMTGMGRDGALGLSAIREAGGGAIVEDEPSSAVFGMPLAALETCGAHHVLPPGAIGPAAARLLAVRRAAA
jgi:two-component system chemotaxis response regulator CheB